ncbi:MAG TPA: hypothetical protein VNQ80_18315 [Parapedobacter sp.]|uniref:hypothetical protein n=1 Tax=Parapedobacter sp. TaxID=1958893 RepID=UPI002C580CA8|nr:hypothetical protein [Parapedobacter sp.]HWK59303.1 hypothetical protein [Parapedobacter sp.]
MTKHLTISSLFLVAVIVFGACKKDKPGSVIDPDDGFELPYNKEGVTANKKFVEDEGRSVVKKLEALPDADAIKALNTLADLNMPDVDITLSAVARIGRQPNKVAAIGRTLTTVAEADVTLNNAYGIYEYNHQTGDWDKTASSEKLELRFPALANAQTNNAVLTIAYTSNGQVIDIDGESLELPTAVNASLKVAGEEVLKLVSSYAYESDGLPKNIDVTLTMGGYKATLLAEKGSTTKAEVKFSVNGEELIAASLEAETRNYNMDTFEDEDNLEDLVGASNASIRLGNVQLLGFFDVRKFISALPNLEYPDYPDYYDYFTGNETWGSAEYAAAEAAYDEAYRKYQTQYEAVDKQLTEAEVDALKKYSKFVAVNLSTEQRIATVDFQVYEDKYCYDGICDIYYDYEPVLVFGDESRVSFEDFADTGFDRLISDLEDLIEKFD